MKTKNKMHSGNKNTIIFRTEYQKVDHLRKSVNRGCIKRKPSTTITIYIIVFDINQTGIISIADLVIC